MHAALPEHPVAHRGLRPVSTHPLPVDSDPHDKSPPPPPMASQTWSPLLGQRTARRPAGGNKKRAKHTIFPNRAATSRSSCSSSGSCWLRVIMPTMQLGLIENVWERQDPPPYLAPRPAGDVNSDDDPKDCSFVCNYPRLLGGKMPCDRPPRGLNI